MKRPQLLLYILVFTTFFCKAQETEEMYVKKDLLIILSTKNYKSALETAKKASASLNIELKLRGLTENKTSGLSYSKEECEREDLEYPSYYARGRWDDGIYCSIEYSNAYSGFTKGYYIVIIASGSKEEDAMQAAYKKTKAQYKDAYFKSTDVYMGCMH